MARYVYARPQEARIARGGRGRFVSRPEVKKQTSVTPIPLRSSMYPSAVAKVSSRYTGISGATGDVAQRPTVPQLPVTPVPIERSRAVWEYDSPHYAASSSLSSLSLALTDGANAVPHTKLANPGISSSAVRLLSPVTPPLSRLNSPERHTQQLRISRMPREVSPIVRERPLDIAEMPTFPPLITGSQVVARPGLWKPLDTLRWWLLAPGRLELLLWICGTVLLVLCTALLVWFFSIGWRYFFV